MKIIICGAGKVGMSIAQYLEKYDHDLLVIDHDLRLVRKISDRYDVQAISGYASDPEVLKRAGASNADMIIAVTHSDEVNMTACEVAHALFQIPTKIGRIRNQAYLNPEWAHLFDESNISIDVIISPEYEVARAIGRSLAVPGAFSVSPMADGRMNVIGVKCTQQTPIVNTPITHINSLFPEVELRVIAIERKGLYLIPDSKERILVGDAVYFATATENTHKCMEAFGHHDPSSRRVMILGGGNVGLFVAQYIEEKLPNIAVRIVERDEERAQEIANELSQGMVLCGDALDSEILYEAGAEVTETVVAVTQDDKVNALSALLAKNCGAKNALALINNPGSSALVTSLGVDAVIHPREITVSSILQHVRRGNVKAVHALREDFGEIIDAEVHENSSLVGATLADIEVPKEIMLAAIVRKGNVIIPTESTVIQLGDRVVLVGHSGAVTIIEKMVSARMEY